MVGLINLESPTKEGVQLNLPSGADPPELFVEEADQLVAWASTVQPVGGNEPVKSILNRV